MNTLLEEPVEVVTISLNAQDRCDRCGAQAYHSARKGDLEILMCNHHEHEHRDALGEKGWVIITDESKEL